jgi:outer membrane protein assembly factor BamD (BamD/ComL family)
MRQNIKISKREMKEDKFTTFMLRAKDYVTENWMYFAGGLAAVIIVIGGISLIQSNQTKQENQASEIYYRAMTEYRNGNNQLAIVDFKTIVDQYSSTSRGKDAAFNLGNAYFANGSHPEAKAAFEDYLDKYSDNEYFVTSAIAGIAASLAGMGQFIEAADKYREAAEKYTDFKFAGEYYLKAMQYYIKGEQLESARVVFAKISKELKDSPIYLDAARLAAEHKIKL